MRISTFMQWVDRWERRQQPGWKARRRATAQRISARKARDHKAARELRQRRRQASAVAANAAHVRSVWKHGDDGFRCVHCHTIPLKRWEPVDPGNGWSCSCADDTPEAEGCVYR